MQTIYHLISMLLMNKMIIVVIVIKFWLKNLINKIEGINWFQKRIIFPSVQLLHVGLGSIEENSLLKLPKIDFEMAEFEPKHYFEKKEKAREKAEAKVEADGLGPGTPCGWLPSNR